MAFGMRCPSCGIEIAPDSRFCGGCGARLEPPRVAPTIKVPDAPPAGPSAIGYLPTPMPGSLPPLPSHAPAPRPAPVEASSPSLSMAAAPRKSGVLITIVLLADLGLAGAGAGLLVKGLHKAKGTPAHTPIAPTPPSPAAPSPAPAPAGTEPPKAEPAAARPNTDPKHHADPKRAPEDTYAAPTPVLATDVDRMANDSAGSFRECLQTASQNQPIHGGIRIALLVEPDGKVDHTQTVVNTTRSEPLASCLSQVIMTWTFAPHPGPAASFERPFNYP
jgi:hypothetical protein